MALSFNSSLAFASTKLRVSKSFSGASISNIDQVNYPFGSKRLLKNKRDFSLSVASETTDDETAPSKQGEDLTSSSSSSSKPKRSALTARERLRAARVLSRFNAESKSGSKRGGELGSNVVAALRESERGKKKGLPEAPESMLDDSKRGLPPKGLTFDLPGGNDLFLIVFSFLFISTVMFATTFVVWKLGAIHFNDY